MGTDFRTLYSGWFKIFTIYPVALVPTIVVKGHIFPAHSMKACRGVEV